MNSTLPGPWQRWWPFAVVAMAYGAVALQQIHLPGVYMDAVNPDYMAVRLLNPRHEQVLPWLLPGNYIDGRYPLMISFYHGSQQMWLGLPFFWLFGTTVTGLRLTHALFALGVLAAMYALLGRNGLKPWQAALACAALAIDPSFSYAFRTQSYITLAPVAWMFLCLYALTRSAQDPAKQARWLFATGLFYGFAVVGYFIYAFFLPALVLALRWYGSAPRPRAAWAALAGGLALGAIGYPIGYWLAVDELGGFAQAWNYFQQTQRAIDAFSGQHDLGTRLAHAWTMIDAVFRNWYHHSLIFGEYGEVPGGKAKMAVLLGATVLLWARAEWKRQAAIPLRLMVALAISFVAVALVFGTRLSGHHYVVLVPISYAALVLALASLAAAPRKWQSAGAAVALPLAVLLAFNVGGQVREALRLQEIRGAGLYSDAINKLALDLDASPRRPFAYFPDWGLFMPVAFMTGGRIGIDTVESFDAARKRLCEGRDLAIVFITGDRVARLAHWQQKLAWDTPAVVTPYRQGDGKVVFELATLTGRRDGPGCPG